MVGQGLAGSLRPHHLLSPPRCHLKEEHDGDEPCLATSCAALEHNGKAGLRAEPSRHPVLNEQLLHPLTPNCSPAFHKVPVRCYRVWIAAYACKEHRKSQALWRSCLRDFIQNYHLQFY